MAAAILLSGWLHLRGLQDQLRAQIERELSSFADFKVAKVRGWREEQKSDWGAFVENPLINGALRSAVASGGAGATRSELATALRDAVRRTGASAALVLDRDGRVAAATAGAAEPTRRELVLMRSLVAYADPVDDDGERADDPLTLMVAIGPTRAAGALLVRYDPRAALTQEMRALESPTHSFLPLVVRRDGAFAVSVTTPLRADAARLPLSVDTPATLAVRGQTGLVERTDYRGVPVLAALRSIPGSSWHLVVKIDRSDAFASARGYLVTFVLGSVLLLCMGGLATWFWWRSQVTALQQREQQLVERALRERFDAVWSRANDIVFVLDRDRRFVEVNERAIRTYGYAKEELLRMRIDDLRADGGAGLEADWARARESAVRFETTHRCKDGRLFPVEVSSTRISGEGEWHVVSIVRDLTDRHAAAAERERAAREQQRLQSQLVFADRLASIGTLAAGVAHEINNPLSYVLANLDFLEAPLRARTDDGDGEAAAQLQAAQEARDGARRIREIVGALRTFSRNDGRRGSGAVDVSECIRSVLRMAEAQARPRARLVLDLQETPRVAGKEHEVAQVVLNLVVNAIQAIPEGQPDRHEVRVTTRAGAGGSVEVSVRDTGCGVPPENLARIFDPFFTTKGPGEGSGLGLSICHGIVQTMGGTISVESTPGQGSAFTVRLPPLVLPPEEPEPPPTPAARRGRILVLDDEPLVCRSVERILGSAHDVVAMVDPRGALERVAAGETFDLVLCDLVMPEMSGMEYFEELTRRRPSMAGRVVFLTGGAFTPRAREFLEENPGRCVKKPFEAETLRAHVAQALRS
jgi:PAS domain S-box-containing protein